MQFNNVSVWMKAALHKTPSEGNRCAFIPGTEIALIWLRLCEGSPLPPPPPPPPPSEAESLTSNLLERNQNVRRLHNLQADERGLYFIYNSTLQISSLFLTVLDLQRLNMPPPPPHKMTPVITV